jgi:FkbM family methyltransferase
MPSFRSLTRPWLPRNLKTTFEKVLLGYHSYIPSFSSAGEDMILRHLVGSDKRGGFFVDVGAYHPTLHSNTYFFYLQEWRGINIEARPGSKKLFDEVRPGDVNLETGISAERGEITYYMIAEDSTMNSFSRTFLESIDMMGQVKREVQVPVMPLAEVLERYVPKGQTIDFMNVDTEGHDSIVLNSNDWQRFRPKFIVVEDNEVDQRKSEIIRSMESRGYEVCAQNVIILDKLNEYFLIDRTVKS